MGLFESIICPAMAMDDKINQERILKDHHEQVRQAHREREHFFNAAKVVAGLTLVSRIFGLFRDMGITSLGANRSTDAFGLAFQIPNLFRRLFGEGALPRRLCLFLPRQMRKAVSRRRRNCWQTRWRYWRCSCWQLCSWWKRAL